MYSPFTTVPTSKASVKLKVKRVISGSIAGPNIIGGKMDSYQGMFWQGSLKVMNKHPSEICSFKVIWSLIMLLKH